MKSGFNNIYKLSLIHQFHIDHNEPCLPPPPPPKKKQLALLDEPQSTLKNETLSDLVDATNQANNLSEKVDERSVNFKIVIGTLTSSNDTKGDLTICLNQHQTGGSLLKRIAMVCA